MCTRPSHTYWRASASRYRTGVSGTGVVLCRTDDPVDLRRCSTRLQHAQRVCAEWQPVSPRDGSRPRRDAPAECHEDGQRHTAPGSYQRSPFDVQYSRRLVSAFGVPRSAFVHVCPIAPVRRRRPEAAPGRRRLTDRSPVARRRRTRRPAHARPQATASAPGTRPASELDEAATPPAGSTGTTMVTVPSAPISMSTRGGAGLVRSESHPTPRR